MNDKRKKSISLLKNIGLFFLASFLPKTISFFMVPLYTQCLSTEEYGIIDLLITTAQLLLPVLTLQVQDAVLRFTMDRGNPPEEVFSLGLRIVLGGFVIVLAGTGAACGWGLLELEGQYIAYFLLYYLTGALHNVFTYFLRAIDRVKHITAASVLNTVVTVGCNLLFLLLLRWGVSGYLLANSLGHVCSLIYLWASVGLGRYVTFRRVPGALRKQILLFSIPMVISALSWWVNNSLDKYIVTWFCGVSASGLLAVAYKIPTIITTFGMTVSKAFSVSVIQDFDPEDTDGFLGQSYGAISFLMVLCTSGLILVNVPLSRMLFSNDYFQAWQLVPPLLVSALMNHMALSCEHICIALKKTRVISATAMAAAVGNTTLNLCLIPRLGAYGAALATAAGFSVLWLIRYLWVIRHVRLKNCRVKEPVSYGLLLCQMVLARWGSGLWGLQLMCMAVILIMYRKETMAIAKKLRIRR